MALPNRNPSPYLEPEDERRIWRIVSHAPLPSLWHIDGVTAKEIARRAWSSIVSDQIFDRAAELGFYLFLALFPALFCASAIFGMVLRSAHQIYANLLGYMAVVLPQSAVGIVMSVFNQTTSAASSGKITLSFLGAVWTASVGISAIQDTLNDVYKLPNSRSYLGARFSAIGLTILVALVATMGLGALFGGTWAASFVRRNFGHGPLITAVAYSVRVGAWSLSAALLLLVFALIYYWAPDWRGRRWRWWTPGGLIGVAGWLVSSVGFRLYLRYFNTYSITYGSLGAVIILLMWFYITGLMLLVGGELNSEIEAAAVEQRLIAKRKA